VGFFFLTEFGLCSLYLLPIHYHEQENTECEGSIQPLMLAQCKSLFKSITTITAVWIHFYFNLIQLSGLSISKSIAFTFQATAEAHTGAYLLSHL